MTDLTPVVLAPARCVLFDARRQAVFCENLSHNGNVRLACRAAGVSAQTAYRSRRAAAGFRACWDAALVLARGHAEAVLAERALNGVDEAVFYHGEEVATRRRFDSRLLLAHLARLDRLAEAAEGHVTPEGFDAALARLENGEQVLPAQGNAVAVPEGDEQDLPPVEAALRWLEAQGYGEDDSGDGECDLGADAEGSF